MPIYESSLSVEIFETIIRARAVILAASERDSTSPISPRQSLAPICVSKCWRTLAEKHVYRSICVGWPHKPGQPIRDTERLAEGLLAPLSAKSRLEKLVELLELYFRSCDQETVTRIIQLCPNVKHVQIRGCDPSTLDTLIDVLKGRSLLSFSICPHVHSLTLSTYPIRLAPPGNGTSVSQLFEMMQKWPKLGLINL